MINKYFRSCSTSLAIRDIEIETALEFHLTPVRTIIVMETNDTNASEDKGSEDKAHIYC